MKGMGTLRIMSSPEVTKNKFFLSIVLFLSLTSNAFCDSYVTDYKNNKRLYKWVGKGLMYYDTNTHAYRGMVRLYLNGL